jgi:endonuclease/exonuclease/phosphatase family metal-dependent hydrolase
VDLLLPWPQRPVLAMGDFNDEPHYPSLAQHLSTRQGPRFNQRPRLLNLMWPALYAGAGSFYCQNFANLLDQTLINKNMIRQDSPIHADPATVRRCAAGRHPPSGCRRTARFRPG